MRIGEAAGLTQGWVTVRWRPTPTVVNRQYFLIFKTSSEPCLGYTANTAAYPGGRLFIGPAQRRR